MTSTVIIFDDTIRIEQSQGLILELRSRSLKTESVSNYKERGMPMENLDVRLIVADAKLSYKAIAKQIGVTPEWLSRCMRYPLKPEMRQRILDAVDQLRGGGGDNG